MKGRIGMLRIREVEGEMLGGDGGGWRHARVRGR